MNIPPSFQPVSPPPSHQESTSVTATADVTNDSPQPNENTEIGDVNPNGIQLPDHAEVSQTLPNPLQDVGILNDVFDDDDEESPEEIVRLDNQAPREPTSIQEPNLEPYEHTAVASIDTAPVVVDTQQVSPPATSKFPDVSPRGEDQAPSTSALSPMEQFKSKLRRFSKGKAKRKITDDVEVIDLVNQLIKKRRRKTRFTQNIRPSTGQWTVTTLPKKIKLEEVKDTGEPHKKHASNDTSSIQPSLNETVLSTTATIDTIASETENRISQKQLDKTPDPVMEYGDTSLRAREVRLTPTKRIVGSIELNESVSASSKDNCEVERPTSPPVIVTTSPPERSIVEPSTPDRSLRKSTRLTPRQSPVTNKTKEKSPENFIEKAREIRLTPTKRIARYIDLNESVSTASKEDCDMERPTSPPVIVTTSPPERSIVEPSTPDRSLRKSTGSTLTQSPVTNKTKEKSPANVIQEAIKDTVHISSDKTVRKSSRLAKNSASIEPCELIQENVSPLQKTQETQKSSRLADNSSTGKQLMPEQLSVDDEKDIISEALSQTKSKTRKSSRLADNFSSGKQLMPEQLSVDDEKDIISEALSQTKSKTRKSSRLADNFSTGLQSMPMQAVVETVGSSDIASSKPTRRSSRRAKISINEDSKLETSRLSTSESSKESSPVEGVIEAKVTHLNKSARKDLKLTEPLKNEVEKPKKKKIDEETSTVDHETSSNENLTTCLLYTSPSPRDS